MALILPPKVIKPVIPTNINKPVIPPSVSAKLSPVIPPKPITGSEATASDQSIGKVTNNAIREDSNPNNSITISDSLSEKMQTQLDTLYKKLDANIPDLKDNLRIIYNELKQDPAIVTILSEDEIGIIFRGLSRMASIEVVAASAKKRGGKSSQVIDTEDALD
jgi:hypothetical protein